MDFESDCVLELGYDVYGMIEWSTWGFDMVLGLRFEFGMIWDCFSSGKTQEKTQKIWVRV